LAAAFPVRALHKRSRVSEAEDRINRFDGGDRPLEASSPNELRVNLGTNLPETDVRTALATGDIGFLHSLTTGSAVGSPGVLVVAWTTGCMWRCLYCHNPDTWTMSALARNSRRRANLSAAARPD
jgi:hypothetical protein